MYLDWGFSATDKIEVNFAAGKGKITLPTTWLTQIK